MMGDPVVDQSLAVDQQSLSTSEATFIQTHGHAVTLAMHPYLVKADADQAAGFPVNQTAPVLTGTGTVGQILTTSNGTWLNSPSGYSYSWYRNGVLIAGQAASTYTLVAGDSGKTVTCQVTATNATGSRSQLSNGIAVA